MKISIISLLLILTFSLQAEVQSVRPWIGVGIDKGKKGVLVNSTYKGAPAEAAGIMKDDEILSIDGKAVMEPREMIDLIGKKGVGHVVKVELFRAGQKILKEITLVTMPDMLSIVKNKLLGKKVPDFTATVVRSHALGKEKIFTMHKQLGKITIIEFWATWCSACVASHPRLLEFARENHQDIHLVSISDQEIPLIKKYLADVDKKVPASENFITYLTQKEGTIHQEFMISSIPIFFVLDKEGTVVELDLGGGFILEKILKKALSLK